MYGDNDPGGRRVGAAAATLAIHAGIAAVLIWGLAERGAPPRPDAGLTTVDLSQPPPPPPPPPSPEPSRAAAKNAPAPEAKKAEAAPREAPPVALPLPVPAPAARVAGDGSAAKAGAGAQGSGSGSGGNGNGTGGGGDGGGLASGAVRIAGALRDSDYPREAEGQGLAGTVAISFRVRSDGGVDRCRVVRSSGAALLDDLTCRLFVQRFRFRPATNAAGQPVDSNLSTSFTWGTRRRR